MAGTAAWIDVLPNLSLFGTKLNSGVTAAAAAAGRNAGRKFSDSMNSAAGANVLAEQVKNLEAAEKRAKKAVATATAQIAKARDEQKSAALRVQAAENEAQRDRRENTAHHPPRRSVRRRGLMTRGARLVRRMRSTRPPRSRSAPRKTV